MAKTFSDLYATASNFELDRIMKRYRDDHDLPIEIVYAHFVELKRYLILCALNPDKRYPMTDPIDEAWHTFLLFTREYHAFCDAIADRYIHHNPRTKTDQLTDEEIEEERLSFMRFRTDYLDTFQENPPLEYWPYLGNIDHASTCHANNCSRCHGNKCD